jgi:alpha-tubulin suppressor-like RCC1 family protein
LNAATISSLTFQLKEAGSDGKFDTADDVTVSPVGFEYRPALSSAFMKFTNSLPSGLYRAKVTDIFDLKGNKLPTPITWSFQVIGSITGQTTASKIAAGHGDTFVLKRDGTLWACGSDQSSELGFAETDPFATRKLRQVGKATDWLTVAAGAQHTLALKTDGSLWGWGYNVHGEVGDGTQQQRDEPARIGSDNDWRTIRAGPSHSLAIKQDGSLWAWGRNDRGRLGDGTKEKRLAPTRIGTASDWLALAAGDSHTLALKTEGTLWSWGDNSDGQLGDATSNEHDSPQQIGSDTDWIQIAAAGSFSLAVKADGSLWAWGNNETGQLGDGTTNRRVAPQRIGLDNDWAAVAGGAAFVFESNDFVNKNFILGLKLDGSLWSWGANQAGQLGDGTNNERHTPAQIGADKGWKAIAAGSEHSIGLKADGSLWGWGENNRYGELGIWPDIDNKSVPVRIGTSNDWGAAP